MQLCCRSWQRAQKKERKKKKKHITSRLFNFLHWVWTLRWQQKKKKTAMLCFEDGTKAFYILCNNTVHFSLMSLEMNWVCLRHVRPHSSVHLHQRFILLWYSACLSPPPKHPLEHRSSRRFCLTCRTGRSHKSLVFFFFLFFFRQDWTWLRAGGAKVRLNTEIVCLCEPLTNLLRVNLDLHARLNNVWHWQSEGNWRWWLLPLFNNRRNQRGS